MAFFYKRPVRVRLNDDLRRYHAHLVPGSEGSMLPGAKVDMWGSQDRFGAVRFDCCGAMLDVLLTGVTILDEEYLRELAEARAAELASLKDAREVELRLGPRGGFRSLSYRLPGQSRSMYDRAAADEHLAVFAKHDIPVRTIRES